MPASLKQLVASLAKVGRGYYYNFNDVITHVYIEANVELLKWTKVIRYDYLDCFELLDER